MRQFLLPGLACALAACSGSETPLEGEREPVRLTDTSFVTGPLDEASDPLIAAARANTDWPHANGSGGHAAFNAAVEHPLTPVWRTPIGRGNSKSSRITAGPVVAGGLVYAIDAAGRVTAVTPGGAVVWSTDLAKAGEGALDGFGGGLAFGEGTLVATSGFGEVVALEPDSGAVRWRQDLDAPARAPGVVADGRAFVVSRDNEAYAIDLDNGRIRWRTEGIEPDAAMLGGAMPAISRGLVVVPFASGEVVGALARNGRRVWTSSISGGRRGTVRSRIFDITGDPVMDGETVFVANQSGRFVSIDRSSGERNWIVNEGATGPALPTGRAVYFVNDLAQLKRLDRDTGDEVWSIQLPRFEDAERQRRAIYYSGPLLAGGRLVLASGAGAILSFDPATGASLGSVALAGGAAAQPAIADGVLYVVTRDGELAAFQ